MKARIAAFAVIVKDQQVALDFYTEKVGFEKKTDYSPGPGYRYVTIGPQGQDLELSLFEAGTRDPSGASTNWRPGSIPPIVVYVDDCKKAFAELKSRGVRFKQEKPDEFPWGISATFSDPDGNLLSINELPSNPSWKKQVGS